MPKKPLKESRVLDLDAAIAYARNPHPHKKYSKKEMDNFELGARRLFNYLYMNDLLAADEW